MIGKRSGKVEKGRGDGGERAPSCDLPELYHRARGNRVRSGGPSWGASEGVQSSHFGGLF